MITFISSILIIGILIFVHELGHFLYAKLFNVEVTKFSLGFGPALLRFTLGETEYLLCAIPLGGYVRMKGDIAEYFDKESDKTTSAKALQAQDAVAQEAGSLEACDSNKDTPESSAKSPDRSRWFLERPLYQQALIIFGGPLFNLLFAFAILLYSAAIYGTLTPRTDAVIGEVMETSPAQQAGIKEGDLITEVNGKQISTWLSLSETINEFGMHPISVQVIRDGQPLTLEVKPTVQTTSDGEMKSKRYLIGVTPVFVQTPASTMESAWYAWATTWNISRGTLLGIWGLFTGQFSAEELRGPIFIFQAAGKKVDKGLESVLYFMAIISISLAIFNLLPIPVLDGGHLFFILLEAIFGKISMTIRELAQYCGMIFILAITIFAIRNDIVHFNGYGNPDTKKASENIPATSSDSPTANNVNTEAKP